MENSRVVRIENNGKKVFPELYGRFYEELTHLELVAAVEKFEEDNPLEKARRVLRQYRKDTSNEPEVCACNH